MLAPAEITALHDALDSARRALATWRQVLEEHGEVSPFASIVDAQSRHVAALERLFRAHGLPVPPDPWPGRVPRFASRQEACRAGVAAAEAHADLSERLLDSTRRADLLTVFRTMQTAWEERHLPALRRCAESGPRSPPGSGGGRRSGRCG